MCHLWLKGWHLTAQAMPDIDGDDKYQLKQISAVLIII